MKAKRLSKVQRSSRAQRVDRITTLPETIIEIILCLLPIEEAARTSILSREWRFKWTTIPKLVFLEDTVKMSTEKWHLSNWNKISKSERERRKKEMRCKLFYAIHQVLLQRQATIQEFTLSIYPDETCFEIDQILLHLSRNHTLKRLTLDFLGCNSYCLPLCVFSLRHLTDLHLEHCYVDLKPIFNGLGSLVRLTLNKTWISRKPFLHLLSGCPSLKSLCVKLENLIHENRNPSIMELFKCLTHIEHLTTWGYITTIVQDWMPELPPSLIHLKYFCIEELCFGPSNGCAFLGVLLKCSPNLEKIKIEIETDDGYDEIESGNREEEFSLLLEKYSDVWLEHLSELEILYYRNVKLELDLLKFILARSPNLKKVKFRTWMFGSREDLKMLRTLLRPPRARPIEFIFV
ncbi:putative FBD domain, leucine-rich repeat domain superfamily, F-box-like domain superfamily [Helianthus annuus]|nr:putative FBD domain, leucine-rich repeat domain superfamily, F-box-like domain superfamily [Helianthus annuus]